MAQWTDSRPQGPQGRHRDRQDRGDRQHRSDRLPAPARLALATQLVRNAALFAAVPVLSVYLTEDRGLGPAQVASVLTAQLVAARLLPLVTGPAADRWGCRPMMAAGLLVAAAGWLGFSRVYAPAGLFCAACWRGWALPCTSRRWAGSSRPSRRNSTAGSAPFRTSPSTWEPS